MLYFVWRLLFTNVYKIWKVHCVQKKNTHSHFLSYLHELFVDLNKNCNEYTQGLTDSDNVKNYIFIAADDVIMTSHLSG